MPELQVNLLAFDIPNWHPPLANRWVGRHWAVKANLRKQAEQFLGWYAARAGIPKAAGKRRVRLVMTGWPNGKLPDADAFDKVFLDAAVRSGLLLDDNAKGLEGRVGITLVRSSVVNTRVELEDVTDADDTTNA